MSQLLIIGASGHGKVVADTAEAVGKWSQLTFLDDDYANLNGTLRWPVVGGSRDFT
ncbi:MAG: acetyltransferase, partial [Zetaproteobacteria bacterium CG_4_8_14_3_um_filter_59_5]